MDPSVEFSTLFFGGFPYAMSTMCYSGDENEDELPTTPRRRFWRWSQRFRDNPHLQQKTGLQEQDIELAQHTPYPYEGNTEVQEDTNEVR